MRLIGCLTLVLCVSPAGASVSETPEDAARAKSLYRSANVDSELGMILGPIEVKDLNRIIEAAETGGQGTRLTALTLLLQAVAEHAIPDGSQEKVVSQSIQKLRAAQIEDPQVAVLLEQIEWHRRVQGVQERSQKLALLEQTFASRSQSTAFYQTAALEYLVAMGSEGADVVRHAIERGACDYQKLCEASLRRIVLEEALRTAGPSTGAVDLVLTALEQPGVDRRSRRWLIGRLGQLRPISDFALVQISSDPDVDQFSRHAAKVALRPGADRLAW